MIDSAYMCAKLATEIRNQALLCDAFGTEPLGWAVNSLARAHPSSCWIAPEEQDRIRSMACDQLCALLPAIGLSAQLDTLIAFAEAWDGTQALAEPPIPESQIGYHAPAYRAGNEFAHELRSELANG